MCGMCVFGIFIHCVCMLPLFLELLLEINAVAKIDLRHAPPSMQLATKKKTILWPHPLAS